MNIPKDRLLNLKNHQLKDVMSQIESKNPDNITFLINLPKIGFEFDVPYSQLNKKEQKNAKDLIKLFHKLENDQDLSSEKQLKSLTEKIFLKMHKLLSSIKKSGSTMKQ